MKFLSIFLLTLSTNSHASTTELDQSISNLKTALSFVDIESRDRQKLQSIADQIQQAAAKANCGSGSPQITQFTALCRALGTATGEQKGMGSGTSSANLDAAIADAKDKALEDCVNTAKYKSDCEMIRAQDSFQCHQK